MSRPKLNCIGSVETIHDQGADSPQGEYQPIEAENAKEAAEKVCGGPLVEGAGLGNLRATVIVREGNRSRTVSFSAKR